MKQAAEALAEGEGLDRLSSFLMQRTSMVAVAAGAALGFLTWSDWGSLWWLILVPAGWSVAATRRQAAYLIATYYLVGARDVPAIAGEFFPGQPVILGLALWAVHAALLTLPWLLLWPTPGASLRAVAARAAGVTLLLILPPIGFISWLSPLLVAGELFPGAGWAGLAGTVATLSFCAVLARPVAWQSKYTAVGIAMIAAMSILLHATAKNTDPPVGWVSVNTALGKFPTDRLGRYLRQQSLITLASKQLEAGAKVVILPEEVAGNWRPSVEYWWRPVLQLATAKGATVIVGADFSEDGMLSYRDSAVILGGGQQIQPNRIPMPVSLWRPWTADTAIANPFGRGTIEIDGHVAALSICYEDFLAWPILTAMATTPAPAAIISLANNWFATGQSATDTQRRSIASWAKLFGVPLVRALNLGGGVI